MRKFILATILCLMASFANATDVPINFYSGMTGSCGPAGYTDDASTVLLFNAETEPFIDSSHQGHILSAIGPTPAVGTSVSNGCYSFYSTNYVPYTADSNDFTFGTGDFTVEACIKPVGNLAVAGGNIFSKADTIAPSGWGFGYFNPNPSTGRLGFGYKVNSVAVTEKYALTSPFVIGNWYHLEVDRHLNTLYFFVNGNSIGTADISAYPDMRDSNGDLEIGAWGGGGQYVDEARITKGIARHTENFTSHCGDYGWSDKPINFHSRNTGTVGTNYLSGHGALYAYLFEEESGDPLDVIGANHLDSAKVGNGYSTQGIVSGTLDGSVLTTSKVIKIGVVGGLSDYMLLTTSNEIPINSQVITAVQWFLASSGSHFQQMDTSFNIQTAILSGTNTLRIDLQRGTSSIRVQYGISDLNSWHHAAIVYDISTNPFSVKFYLDGELQSPTFFAGSGGTASNFITSKWMIGYIASLVNSGLYIDEAALFDHELTQPEIQEIMNCGLQGTYCVHDKPINFYSLTR